MKQPEKCKVAVIKESLVALTGDFIKAVILNQMIYWSERTKDVDQYIMEETARSEVYGDKDIKIDLTHGWIYKKAIELSEETMLGLKDTAMRVHIKYLVEHGWLEQRRNPNEKWDKTLQYRVNILKIQLDLFKLGFVLDNYKFPFSSVDLLRLLEIDKKLENSDASENDVRTSENEIRESENGIHNSDSEIRNAEKQGAIPETTSETTPEIIDLIIITSWKKVLEHLKAEMSSQSFSTWIDPIKPSLMGNTLVLSCPNEFSKDWISSRFADVIQKTVSLDIPNVNEVVYVTGA